MTEQVDGQALLLRLVNSAHIVNGTACLDHVATCDLQDHLMALGNIQEDLGAVLKDLGECTGGYQTLVREVEDLKRQLDREMQVAGIMRLAVEARVAYAFKHKPAPDEAFAALEAAVRKLAGIVP